MDAGGGNNHPVTRISQRVAQGGHFVSDVRGEGYNPDRGIGVQLMKHLIQSDAEPLSSLVQQYDFKQAESADAYTLSAPHSIVEDPVLPTRQLLGFVEPTDHDVGVEQKSRIQEARSSIAS
jgi:hypothetical protein